MRHKALIEDTREAIRAELHDAHADRDRGPHARPDKAALFQRALDAIDHGAVAVRVEHALYRVIGEKRPQPYLTHEDEREAIAAELERWRVHWDGTDRAAEYTLAAAAHAFGALEVFAGGTLYRVVEE